MGQQWPLLGELPACGVWLKLNKISQYGTISAQKIPELVMIQ